MFGLCVLVTGIMMVGLKNYLYSRQLLIVSPDIFYLSFLIGTNAYGMMWWWHCRRRGRHVTRRSAVQYQLPSKLTWNPTELFMIAELFIDTEKKSYNDLGFQRFGFLGLFPAVLSAAARAAASRVSAATDSKVRGRGSVLKFSMWLHL